MRVRVSFDVEVPDVEPVDLEALANWLRSSFRDLRYDAAGNPYYRAMPDPKPERGSFSFGVIAPYSSKPY
jgi:hypothetical protein